jgi:hypothetical protein
MSLRLAAVLVFILLIPGALGAHVSQLSSRELAAASSNVVVAVVEGREVRWNGKHTLLMTDYTLRVEQRLRGEAPERLTLTLPGGTLGDITDEVCTSIQLEPGARYLLFLDDLSRPSLSTVVGAWQGAFLEGPGFGEIVAAARDLVERTPLALRPAAAVASSLPAKTWKSVSAPFVYEEPAHPPIVVNPLLPGSPFSPVDQERLAYWNVYAGDLFRVSPNPTATWSYGNGVFDIAGFPSDQQMTDQFDVSWGELGSGVLGVAFVRHQDGAVVEADVALNPAKSWTLDDLEATAARDAAYSFKEVITHEIGHMWGLDHPFETQEAWWDSVMQYKFRIYYYGTIYADDAMAVRKAFPPGVAIRDGLVSSYITAWAGFLNTYIPAAPKVRSAKAGASFNLTGPIKIENVGTVALAKPTVEVYLAPQRLSFEGAVKVKTIRVPGNLASGATKKVSVGKVRIPSNLPAGTYWLAYYLRDPKDAYPANNSSWSNFDVTLTVTGR